MTIASVTVVIPSRLQRDAGGRLLAERAVASIMRGTVLPYEIIVGVDKGVVVDPADGGRLVAVTRGKTGIDYVRICAVSWPGKGHQGATNAAARTGTGKYLAILEDDDEWQPKRLEATLEAVEKMGADFVSCSQQEVQESKAALPHHPTATCKVRVNHFPTASGWLLPMELWHSLAGFDESFKIHHDGHFLGKVNARSLSRIHLAPEGTDPTEEWLVQVARHARVMNVPDLRECLVTRHVNGDGVMATASAERSKREYAAQAALFGGPQW